MVGGGRLAYAHSKNDKGNRHDLIAHLESVAQQSRTFAEPFEAGELAYWAGMWHDLGKFHPEFQNYLLRCEASPQAKGTGPDHKRAGTMLAAQRCQPLSLLVKGHHGGLPSRQELPGWLNEPSAQAAVKAALALAQTTLGSRLDPPTPLTQPSWVNDQAGAEFFLRILFSALGLGGGTIGWE